ncbi:exonuclease VII small subunit [Mycetocola sp. BIGb0189]|uniref:tape measure protein n=1 Tax=Mycetocola sp. BIGb0189 TaxID=2940604 RepID=UPI00216A62DC|nr:tape measure protein [Mycetocola sp. BIGb0189]MCS4277714.1 exonuclease VII small subunit [Mycetocola sp. BIGb0189]
MADRQVKVTLDAEVARYLANMERATAATDKLGDASDKAGGKQSAMSKAGEAAAAVIKNLSAQAVVAGVGAVALGAKVFATGAAYNSLQQNARQALSTLMGGAEKANAQMDKLDAFAKNSPFSKAVFIQAQQQLIGFGVEAKKVIPTLDAVQNAVAGIGGSNQQITEVVTILAKIRSGASFGQEDLNQLADRGINAAALMSKAFGQSEMEFRQTLFGNPLKGKDALKAFDALVEGMGTTFAGTTDKIKAQWTGAADRIKAATRDIGSAMAEPFISKNGGGLAVRWGNDVADVLRGVERATLGVVPVLMGRLVPAITAIDKGFANAKVSINGFSATRLDSELSSLGAHAPALGAVAGAIVSMGVQGIPVLKNFLPAINPVAGALIGLAAASPEVRAAGGDILQAFKPLIPVATQLAATFSQSLNSVLPIAIGLMEATAAVVAPLANAFAAIPAPVVAAGLAFFGARSAISGLEGPLSAVGSVFGNVMESFRASRGVADAMGGSVSTLGAMARAGVAPITAIGGAIKTAFFANPIGLILTAAAGAVALFAAANAEAAEKVAAHNKRTQDLRETLNQVSGAATEGTKESVRTAIATEELGERMSKASVSVKELVDASVGGAEGQKLFRDHMLESGRAAVENAGKTAAAAKVADQLGVSVDTVIGRMVGFSDSSDEVSKALQGAGAKALGYRINIDQIDEAVGGALNSQKVMVGFVEQQRAAFDEAQRVAEKYREAQRALANQQDETTRSNQRFNDALAVARDSTQDLEKRVSALKSALNELSGGAKTAAQAELDLAQTNNSLRDFLAQTDENGQKLYNTFIDAAGALDTSSSSAIQLGRMIESASNDMLGAMLQAYDTAAATGDYAQAMESANSVGNQHVESLKATMRQSGLTEEQINALIQKYGEIPTIVTTMLNDNGTYSATEIAALRVTDAVLKVPNKTIEIDDPNSAAVLDTLRLLGFTVTHLPNGKIEVSTNNVPQVERELKGLAEKKREAKIDASKGVDAVSNWLAQLTQQRTVQINAGYGVSRGPVPNENGGLYSYSGRKVQAFENGGFPSGFYGGGRPIYKFAEENVPWELFVSGKPGEEQRNAAFAMEALDRLGMPVVPASQLQYATALAPTVAPQIIVNPEVSLAGAVLSATIDGRPIELMIDSQITRRDNETARNAGLGFRS